MESVPPRGSGWVRSVKIGFPGLRTHPLPRGGTDSIQVRSTRDKAQRPKTKNKNPRPKIKDQRPKTTNPCQTKLEIEYEHSFATCSRKPDLTPVLLLFQLVVSYRLPLRLLNRTRSHVMNRRRM